jgi:hypothetical protein
LISNISGARIFIDLYKFENLSEILLSIGIDPISSSAMFHFVGDAIKNKALQLP